MDTANLLIVLVTVLVLGGALDTFGGTGYRLSTQ